MVIAFDSQLKKFIERGLASGRAYANPRLRLVIVSFGVREPVSVQASLKRRECPEGTCKLAACPCLDRRIHRKAVFRDTSQSTLNTHQACDGISSSEKRALRHRE